MASEIASLFNSSTGILAMSDDFDANTILTGVDTLPADQPRPVCCVIAMQHTDPYSTELNFPHLKAMKYTQAGHPHGVSSSVQCE
jgi:hypothetical protein